MRLDARQKTYFALRGVAALVLVLAALVLPRGVPAGLLAMAAGLVAVMACIGVNAGGPGERAGTAAQDRWLNSIRPPQGEWPPFPEERVVEGEIAGRGAGGARGDSGP